MRNANLTFEEIQAAEKASDDRHRSRNQGYAKMHERDQGTQLLSNNAVMLWHVNKELNKVEGRVVVNDEGDTVIMATYPPEIPEDSFGLELRCPGCSHKKRYIFNLHEFRKYLRWA